MGELMRGVVKWFNDAKGFGFIEHETGKDVFVHYSVIESEGFKTLKDGEEVDYELKEGEKGLHAARVLRVNAPPAAPRRPADGMVVAKPSADGAAGITSSIEVYHDAESVPASIPVSPDERATASAELGSKFNG